MAAVDVSPQLSVQQQLVLAQAVHHAGESDFAKVASLLVKHPLLASEAGASLASAQTCSKTYAAIRGAYPSPEAGPSTKAMKPTLALSRTLYSKRIQELHATISAEEAKFRILNAEIEEIKRGDWDAKLKDPEEREKVLNSGAFEAAASGKAVEETGEKEKESSPAPKEETASPEAKGPPSKDKGRAGRPRRSARGATIETEEDDTSHLLVPDSAEPEEKQADDGEEDDSVELVGKKKTSEAASSPAKDDGEDDDARTGRRGRSSRGRRPSKAPPSTRKSRSQAAEAEAEAADENEAEADDDDAMEVDAAPEKKGSDKSVSPARSPAAKRVRRTSDGAASEAAPDPVAFKRSILAIHSQILQNTSSSVFREPVREADAPDYVSMILHPLDLKTIGRRIREGKITTPSEYRRDVLLMLSNAVVYNQPGSEVARNAKEVATLCDSLVGVFVSSQYS